MLPVHPREAGPGGKALPRILSTIGVLLLALRDETGDPSTASKLQSLAVRSFEAAVRAHQATIRKLENDLESSDLMMARFRLGLDLYKIGSLHTRRSAAGREMLVRAKTHWKLFIRDYDDTLVGTHATIRLGMCHRALPSTTGLRST